MKRIIALLFILFCLFKVQAQEFPGKHMNSEWFAVYGPQAPDTTGDEWHFQVFYLVVPGDYEDPFYLRVYDPDAGEGRMGGAAAAGSVTRTRFSVYGGSQVHRAPRCEIKGPTEDPSGETLLASDIFGMSSQHNEKWTMLAKMNADEGYTVAFSSLRVFKVVVEGLSGDAANYYRLYLSKLPGKNVPLEESNGFSYRLSLRLPPQGQVAHFYPYITPGISEMRQGNLNFPGTGALRLASEGKRGEGMATSQPRTWAMSSHTVHREEHHQSLDFQVILTGDTRQEENTVFSVFFADQNNRGIAMYAIPFNGQDGVTGGFYVPPAW